MTTKRILTLLLRTHSNACVIADCDICFAVQQGLAGIASELIQRVRPLPREHARSFARLYTPERLIQEANQLQRGPEQIELRLSNLLMKVHGRQCTASPCDVCCNLQLGNRLLATRELMQRGQVIPALVSLYQKLFTDARLQQELARLQQDPFERLCGLVYDVHFCEDNHCAVCAALKLHLPVAAARQLSSVVQLPAKKKEPIEILLDDVYTQERYLQELRALMEAPHTACPTCGVTLWVAPGAVVCDGCETAFFWNTAEDQPHG